MLHNRSVFVFEWFSGGGRLGGSVGTHQDHSFDEEENKLLMQGWSMLSAVVSDLSQAGLQTIIPIDYRLTPETVPGATWHSVETQRDRDESIDTLANRADLILMIAPETDGCLARLLTQRVIALDRLVSPNLEFVELASDKTKTCDRLASAGISVPFGYRLDDWNQHSNSHKLSTPWVLKPNQGAGSSGNLVYHQKELEALPMDKFEQQGGLQKWRIESFQNGTPVSVSVLCGKETILLLPTIQKLSGPVGEWEGCELCSDPGQILRAKQLAQQAIDCLPKTSGYIGIDLVLGENPVDDCVIEVNPRLTTSYVTLRDLVDFNIAERMILNSSALGVVD